MTMVTPARSRLLDRLAEVIVCPTCHGPLVGGACATCGETKLRRSPERFDFGGIADDGGQTDWLDRLKSRAKHGLGRFYPLAIDVLAPVYGDVRVEPFLAGFDLERELVCDLGAGTTSHGDRVVCVDGYAYETVHLACDLGALPIKDGALDGVISQAVLEHVPDPAAHVAEMWRVLKPGGRLLCYFPFIAAFHASPHDYTRLTRSGLQRLFARFEVDEIFVSGGPTSGLLWTLQEWLAIAGSFGSERLYRLLVPVTWVLSPLKYLDAILIKHPAAHVIASGLSIIARKPS